MPRKEIYWRNPEKHRKATQRWKLENSDQAREAGKLWMRTKRARLGKHAVAVVRQTQKAKNPIQYLLTVAKKRATKLGVPFALTRQDLVMPPVCPVFGVAWEFGVGKMGWRNWKAPSLDRIRPELGYVPGNVAIISSRANHLKNNASISEMEAVLAYMKRVGANEERGVPLIPHLFDPPSPQMELGL